MKKRSSRRPRATVLVSLLFALLGTPSAQAQFSGGGLKSPNPGTMSKSQQQKFSRAGSEDITNENFPETIESFDFPNADIADIVKAISELTGRNFMLDPGVRGKVTIIAPSKITVAEAYKMFLSALAIHGYAIVPSDGYYKIRPSRAAQRDSIETYSGTYYPNTDQMITKIIHLKYISADEVLKQFRNLATKDGDINAYAPTNSLIISDFGTNVDRIVKIINQLDVPGFEDQIEVVPIRSAKAKDLAELIEKIVNKGQTPNNRSGGGISSGFQGAVPRFTRSGNTGASGQQGGAYFMAFPDERTNALIVVGNKAGIARVRKLVAQLDIRMNPADAGGVYVYYVKFGDAEKIAQVINGVAKDAGGDQSARRQSGSMGPGGFLPPSFLNTGPDGQPQSGSGQIFGGDVKVTADKTSNSLVIVASRQDYEKVINLLNRLDIAQDQVFVEAIITEMSMQDADSWKVGFFQYGKYGKGGFSTFDAAELANLTSIAGGQGVIIPFADGEQQFTQIVPGQNGAATSQPITVPNILGFINFLKREGKANVLSTPRILALNNQEAQIKVVDRVPTSLATATNIGGQTSNITFEDAGIDLKIKPFISPASETIRMEITQLVSQPTNATSVPAELQRQATVIAKREIKTNIVIRNGDTAVLGGLIREQESERVSKVPLLGDIPVLGWLFKSNTRDKDKINLMVFLTPKVIRNSSDQKDILSRALDERLSFIKDQGGKDPYGAKMDELRRFKADANGNVRATDPELAPAPQDPGVVDLSAPQPTPAELEDSTVE